MIVPRYWAEAKLRERKDGRQVTVRRFGWADTSQSDAQLMADDRCREALQRLLAGEKLERREPRMPYNGASGVPIREEIVETRGDAIVTRNSYGALCLNTPDAFFADVDLVDTPVKGFSKLMILTVIASLGLVAAGFPKEAAILFLAVLFIRGLVKAPSAKKTVSTKETREQMAVEKIRAFATAHPAWNLRIYRTPAGLRVMATHAPLDPRSEEVSNCFSQLDTDPIYREMCVRQNCFRARVSPKPWRVGIGHHIRPRQGAWPVNPDLLPRRNEWIRAYEHAASRFASCEFIESTGSGMIHHTIAPVVQWHEELARAESGLPIA